MKRSLGLFTSVKIGVGTMTGAGIFILAGTSCQLTGPPAFLVIFLSCVASAITLKHIYFKFTENYDNIKLKIICEVD